MVTQGFTHEFTRRAPAPPASAQRETAQRTEPFGHTEFVAQLEALEDDAALAWLRGWAM